VTSLGPGTILANRYRVVRLIAEGGMGAVFEVEQAATGARRALKVMHGDISRDERQRTRFIQEARVGATIASDHVAKVIDAGVDDATGTLFIVMDLLEGRTLGQEVKRRGALSLHETYDVLRQLCHALEAAHRMGIIHRDLKPSNVFLSVPQVVGMDFMVRVLDFGIAKLAAEANAGATAIVGTPSWMAPEQTDPNAPVTRATDIWPLGLIAFKMLTGRHYFPSGNVEGAPTAAMLRDVVLEPIEAASVRAAIYGAAHAIPPGFDPWFARCVVREPRERFGSAQEAFAAFAALASPHLGAAAPQPIVPALASTLPISGESPSRPGAARAAAGERPTAVEGSGPWGPVTGGASVGGNASASGGPRSPAVYVSATKASPRTGGGAAGGGSRTGLWIGLGAAGLAFLGVLGVAGWLGLERYRARAADAPPLAASVSPSPSASSSGGRTGDGAVVLARLHGSNTIGEQLAPALVEAYLQHRAGVSAVARSATGDAAVRIEAHPAGGAALAIDIEARGSGTGFKDLAAGAADLAMSSRRVEAEEAKTLAARGDMTSAACENVLALDGIAIIENPSNPVARIDKGALAKIFAGETTRWREVGGRDAPIAVYARDEKSGTLDLLKSLVLGGRSIAPGAKRFGSSDELSAAVAADANGIGFVGVGAVRSSRPVMLDGMGGPPLVPSPATIAAEEYPLTRRLYLYTPADASADVRDFVEFALSDDGQKVVAQVGFVDLRPTCEPPTSTCAHCSHDYTAATAGACRVSAALRFDADSGQLDARALRDLQRLGLLMRRSEYATKGIVLAAFGSGSTKADALARSAADADAIAVQLRARGLRVVSAKGYGADNPIADDAAPAGRERNRRVELWLR
jgi:phosphate binding protein